MGCTSYDPIDYESNQKEDYLTKTIFESIIARKRAKIQDAFDADKKEQEEREKEFLRQQYLLNSIDPHGPKSYVDNLINSEIPKMKFGILASEEELIKDLNNRDCEELKEGEKEEESSLDEKDIDEIKEEEEKNKNEMEELKKKLEEMNKKSENDNKKNKGKNKKDKNDFFKKNDDENNNEENKLNEEKGNKNKNKKRKDELNEEEEDEGEDENNLGKKNKKNKSDKKGNINKNRKMNEEEEDEEEEENEGEEDEDNIKNKKLKKLKNKGKENNKGEIEEEGNEEKEFDVEKMNKENFEQSEDEEEKGKEMKRRLQEKRKTRRQNKMKQLMKLKIENPPYIDKIKKYKYPKKEKEQKEEADFSPSPSEIIICIIGEEKNGKTSFIKKYTRNVFDQTYKKTENIDTYNELKTEYDSKEIKLTILDTPALNNKKNIKIIQENGINKSHIIIYIVDINDEYADFKVKLTMQNFEFNQKQIILIIGNKSDKASIFSKKNKNTFEIFCPVRKYFFKDISCQDTPKNEIENYINENIIKEYFKRYKSKNFFYL